MPETLVKRNEKQTRRIQGKVDDLSLKLSNPTNQFNDKTLSKYEKELEGYQGQLSKFKKDKEDYTSGLNEDSEPALSSKDKELEASEMKSKLDKEDERFKPNTLEEANDKSYEEAYGDDEQEIKAIKTESVDAIEQVNNLFDKNLEILDSGLNTKISEIKNTYTKRIKEIEELNKRNLETQKAYGLAAGGFYNPVGFRNVISAKEKENIAEVNELVADRESLISAARQAYEEGNLKVTESQLDKIRDIKQDINDKIDKITKDSNDKYKLLIAANEAESDKRDDIVKKRAANLVSKLRGSISKLDELDQESLNAELLKIAQKEGIPIGDALNAYYQAKDDELATQTREANLGTKDDSGLLEGIPETFKNKEELLREREKVAQRGKKALDLFDKKFNRTVSGGEANFTFEKTDTRNFIQRLFNLKKKEDKTDEQKEADDILKNKESEEYDKL